MKTITLHPTDIHKGPLILINSDYPYYENPHLRIIEDHQILLEKTTMNLYNQIINDPYLKKNIMPTSGYRTAIQQTQIYNDSLKENCLDFTQRFVALPQHSEHQSGLAIDLSLSHEDIDLITPHFVDHSACEYFKNRALEYGFIQRYTKEKQFITNIDDEPWHFRYIGIPHSFYMFENNLCLEEYIDHLKQYSIYQPLHYCYQNRLFTIFYVPVAQESVHLSLTDQAIYQISGNNVDGFVVTSWRAYV